MQVHHAAASDSVGTAKFPSGCDSEQCSFTSTVGCLMWWG
jgi:hypothetical protein